MLEGESKDSLGSECFVCYEKFRDLEGVSRILSCGYMFCYDCFVKYLFFIRVDGQVQRIIVCFICRYVIFFSKKSFRWFFMLDKSFQSLVVFMGLFIVLLLDIMGYINFLVIFQFVWRLFLSQSVQLFLDLLFSLFRELQIFIISRYGMFLGEQDSVLSRRSVVEFFEVFSVFSFIRLFCCRFRVLLFIIFIVVLVVVVVVLFWVLLVRKQV